MSTTVPNLASSSDAATAALPAAAMPIDALAWSAEVPCVDPGMGAPIIPASKPRSARTRAALAAALLGAISVGAALGVAVLDRTDHPSPTPPAPVVIDGTDSVPSVPSAPPTVTASPPSVAEAVVPTGAVAVPTKTVAPPTVVVSPPQVGPPPQGAPHPSTTVGGGYPGYDPTKPTEHHDWDHDWDHDRDHGDGNDKDPQDPTSTDHQTVGP
jgi:hypothetical protein